MASRRVNDINLTTDKGWHIEASYSKPRLGVHRFLEIVITPPEGTPVTTIAIEDLLADVTPYLDSLIKAKDEPAKKD